MPHRLVTLCLALSLALSAALAPGCAPAALERPVVREGGRVLSVLSFPPGRREVVLPLTPEGPLMLTDAVTINGRPAGWFVVDTGAMLTVLDRHAAERLGVTAAEPWKWAPEGPPDGLFRVDRLDVGGVALSNHVVGVADLSGLSTVHRRPIAGALGGDVLGAVPFTVDLAEGRLALHRRDGFRPPRGATEHRMAVRRPVTAGPYIEANPSAGQPSVAATVDGVRTSMMLDTGAGVPLLLEADFTAAHRRFVDPGAPTVARAVGAAGPRGVGGRELVRAKVRAVDALGVRFVCAGTALALRRAEAGDRRYKRDGGIIGTPFLQHGRLTFDYATRRLWVEWRRPGAGGEEDEDSG